MACGRKAPQSELLRLAVSGGRVRIDPLRRLPGRGAYICPRRECRQALMRDRGKGRIFRRQLGEEAWTELFTSLENEASPVSEENG